MHTHKYVQQKPGVALFPGLHPAFIASLQYKEQGEPGSAAKTGVQFSSTLHAITTVYLFDAVRDRMIWLIDFYLAECTRNMMAPQKMCSSSYTTKCNYTVLATYIQKNKELMRIWNHKHHHFRSSISWNQGIDPRESIS